MAIPDVLVMAAIEVSALDHVPPVVVLVSVVFDPAHTLSTPVIVAGSAFTVSGIVVIQPAPVA